MLNMSFGVLFFLFALVFVIVPLTVIFLLNFVSKNNEISKGIKNRKGYREFVFKVPATKEIIEANLAQNGSYNELDSIYAPEHGFLSLAFGEIRTGYNVFFTEYEGYTIVRIKQRSINNRKNGQLPYYVNGFMMGAVGAEPIPFFKEGEQPKS